MRSLVDEVKEKLDVVDVIAGYVKITPAGTNYRGLCPFHREKTPSFMVSREKQIYHCFGCGKGGDVIGFVQEFEGIDFKEALKVLAERAGIDQTRWRGGGGGSGAGDKKEIMRRILEATTGFYERQLNERAGAAAKDYLAKRGLKEESIKIFRLGYAPREDSNGFPAALGSYLVSQGYEWPDILATGSVYKKDGRNVYVDRFRERVIFPIADSLGRIVGFSARLLPGSESPMGKYINTPQTNLYDKSALLYGFHLAKTAIREKGEIVLLEGNLDVILSHQAGVTQAAATCGTAVSEKQLKFLRRYVDKLILAFDADLAGVKASKRTGEMAWREEFDVKVIPLPPRKDVADIAQTDPEEWQNLVLKRKSLAGFFYQLAFKGRKLNLDQKKTIAEKLLKFFALLPSRVEQNHYLKKLAEKLDMPEALLWEKIEKISRTASYDAKRSVQTFGAADPKIGENQIIDRSKRKSHLLEERLIGILYALPRLFGKYREECVNTVFVNPATSKIWGELNGILEKMSSAELEKAKSKNIVFTNRSLQLAAAQLAFDFEKELENSPGEDREKCEEELTKCLKSLQLEFLMGKRKELLGQIRNADRKAQLKEMPELMRQLHEISLEITRMGKK